MILYILRHGIAAEAGAAFPRDADRPLTAEGERKLWSIAKAMEKMELSLDLILTSPYLRARQTAGIIAESLRMKKKVQLLDALKPAGGQDHVLAALKALEGKAENVMLVGHEPSLSELVSRLISGRMGCSLVLKKGGLCRLEAHKIGLGPCATMEWLLTPKQMLLMT